jgi:hypothetical protein
MIVPGSGSPLLMGGADGYQISRSVRLRSSASAYFSRTPASAGSLTTWTWSGWIKRGTLGALQAIFSSGTSNITLVSFQADDTLRIRNSTVEYITTQVFRDPSAWYHIVLQWNTTNGTAANRVLLYVNGSQVTSFSTQATASPSEQSEWNKAQSNQIGRYAFNGTSYFDGYLTEINFVDGQALTPTSFGAFDAVTGIWNPIRYSGTYGTNGFYLNFSDNSGATATTIGKDSSGNGNNWTPNNISVTAGTTYDSMVDTPTNYGIDTGAGGEVRGNYCVMNPLDKYSNVTVSNGNLDCTFSAYTGFIRSSFALPNTGKWYWEGTVPTTDVRAEFGIATLTQSLAVDPQSASGCWFWYSNGTNSYKYNGSQTAWGTAWASGDIIGIAFDAGAGTLTFYKNGSLQGGGAAFTGLTGTYAVMVGFGNNTSTAITSNFGQRAFAYTAPSGFKALCTQNLPAPSISNGANYVAASLYTGTGASQTISNAVNSISFQPDLVWIKSRSAATDHKLTDSVRGTTKALISNTTGAETTDSTGLTAFGSSGFTVGANTTYNNSGATYVGWQWKGGGTAVTNTSGTVNSSVSANTTAGFSVVTFTAPTSGNFSAGHGLGVTPGLVITKVRGRATSWITWHSQLNSGSPGTSYYVELNTTAAQASFAAVWGSTGVTSSVIGMGVGASCAASDTIVAYCFAAISGYSAFGSYTGNGSTDGAFIYTGFRPRYILHKASSTTSQWMIWDTSRNTYNVLTNAELLANSSASEGSGAWGTELDILSNGFKFRGSDNSNFNYTGVTYIYAAFAENPFTLSRAR